MISRSFRVNLSIVSAMCNANFLTQQSQEQHYRIPGADLEASPNAQHSHSSVDSIPINQPRFNRQPIHTFQFSFLPRFLPFFHGPRIPITRTFINFHPMFSDSNEFKSVPVSNQHQFLDFFYYYHQLFLLFENLT